MSEEKSEIIFGPVLKFTLKGGKKGKRKGTKKKISRRPVTKSEESDFSLGRCKKCKGPIKWCLEDEYLTAINNVIKLKLKERRKQFHEELKKVIIF